MGVVEVETTESINHLEAMSQWAAFSRLRVPFHLYVPSGSVDSARRLANDQQISIAELWSYNAFGDQIRFTLVNRANNQPEPKAVAKPVKAASPRPAPRVRAASPAPARTVRRPAPAVSARRKPAVAAKAKAAPPRRGAAKVPAKSASRSTRTQKRR
jgi:hypothetical protein